MSTPTALPTGERFARFVYRWRWPSSLLTLAFVALTFAQGMAFIDRETRAILDLGEFCEITGASIS